MMANLFSVFDPSTSILKMNLNWISSMIGFLIIPSIYWLIPNRMYFIWNKISMTLHQEFKTLMKIDYKISSTSIFIMMFMMILINNVLGLFPYIFTSTSHLTMTLSFSLTLWLMLMIYGWMNTTQNMFAHLIPAGTPSILMPFMVLIETISNLIRPMTLAVRLSANMIAGHLLITLLSQTTAQVSIMMIGIMIIVQILLLTLESAVAVIQAYVFSTLSTLYSSEIN
uniref:ATP synthase F0 subunit 6 n=1 Tax=Agapetus zniachtl TaxID=1875106 RepID=UPI0022DCDEA2|nr:ATP synthase F0 subunit 6 [Agapetus zniachtl]UZZ43731.1 ATP synthase F0 subunit 6 [Agapetus zniachtl]